MVSFVYLCSCSGQLAYPEYMRDRYGGQSGYLQGKADCGILAGNHAGRWDHRRGSQKGANDHEGNCL